MSKKHKWLYYTAIVTGILVFTYFVGPIPDYEPVTNNLPTIELSTATVEKYVEDKEAEFDIRPDNEARIVWANDSLKNKTNWCVLYLHGFSACWYEGHPVHTNIGNEISANVYLSRLHDHGIDKKDALIDMQPGKLYESAKEALLIARALGDSIIIVSTSTGGTLSLQLAADFPEMVDMLVLLSPNVAINDPAAFLLAAPWGLQIARLSDGGSKFRDLGTAPEVEEKYWYQQYRWEATVFLKQLVDITMNKSTFEKVTQPVFLGYYYKNDDEQDPVVRVDAMIEMFEQLGTPEENKVKVAFPNAGRHVIGCQSTSNSYQKVETEIIKFVNKQIKP
jgi:pimeloyl-ACP methyl ester carboxylesterase